MELKYYDDMEYHPLMEEITSMLSGMVQNDDKAFFRLITNYHAVKVPSMMGAKIALKGRGTIPINVYALCFALSGYGKNYSNTILEDHIFKQFRAEFSQTTVPVIADETISKLAVTQSIINGTDPDEEKRTLDAVYTSLGEMYPAFDEATVPAIKQQRLKLLMAGTGSMNLEIDEFGSNLLKNLEGMNAYLELYDAGKIKQKLTKNTKESKHIINLEGCSPANMLCFGTPVSVFDGGKVEDETYAWLERGGGRRCLVSYSNVAMPATGKTAKELYDLYCDSNRGQRVQAISNQFAQLADSIHQGKTIHLNEPEELLLIQYKLNCEKEAAELSEYETLRAAELKHRHSKAVKLAGAYAFIDGSTNITEGHVYAAIKLTEDSGTHMKNILKRDRHYVKLAKYIAGIGTEVTHVDLAEDLPFYKGGISVRKELLENAIAWGYKNRIIIKKSYTSGIEFLSGETLKPTDLDKLTVSYSNDITTGYTNAHIKFDRLHEMLTRPNMHWINHHLTNGYRQGDNIVEGFNMLVLDVDKGTPAAHAAKLLEDYAGILCTTKRHTPAQNRFRVILPLSFEVKLNTDEYREFMKNIYEWLPFDVDTATGQRARKWATFPGQYLYLKGDKLVDAMDFIPKTSRNDERKANLLGSLSNLERWFVQNTADGNRSNQFIRYALMLVDSGMDFTGVRTALIELNNKLADKLPLKELEQTVLQTVAKRTSTKP